MLAMLRLEQNCPVKVSVYNTLLRPPFSGTPAVIANLNLNMKRFGQFKKKLKHPSVSTGIKQQSLSGNSRAAPVLDPTQPLISQDYGLLEFETLEIKRTLADSESFPVDIIAIHGLGGHPYKTWTHESTGKLWLRDFLPGFLPGCRVYTFGYPSKVEDVNMHAGVQDYARKLISVMRSHIEESPVVSSHMLPRYIRLLHCHKNRPIIFVCHSLGGIVCKQVCS